MESMLIKPNLQTRESVMLAAGRAQFALTDDRGNVLYAKVECKRKNPEGSDKRYAQVPLDEAMHVFISEKGYGTPRLGTYYPPTEGYDTGRFFDVDGASEPHTHALRAAINYVNGGGFGEYANFVGIEVENACGLWA